MFRGHCETIKTGRARFDEHVNISFFVKKPGRKLFFNKAYEEGNKPKELKVA